MATERNPKREPHPYIPHLYRQPKPRTAGGDIYPYLRSDAERREQERREEEQRKKERG
jgi:hypothetical protein